MTPTPSHVATDELIETLERRQTKSMAFEREHGLEGLVTLSIDEASALISALKENGRLREALEPFAAACAKADQHADEVKRAGMGSVSDNATPGWGVRYGHLKAARAALQPQGEK